MARFIRTPHIARANIGSSLDNDQIMRVAPSVFAEEAHESRSERYGFIPTIAVLEGLRKEGFAVVEARQSMTRTADRRAYTKHQLRLRHVQTALARNDVFQELILTNSHDGGSSYILRNGLFRLVCTNGLTADLGQGEEIRVQHSGKVIDKVIEGSFQVLGNTDAVADSLERFRQTQLPREIAQVLAEETSALRWEESPVQASQLLVPRRLEDQASDAWTTMNVIQENVIRGGLRGRNANNGRTTTREVTGIDQGDKLNRALWRLTERVTSLLRGNEKLAA